jgi:ribosomal protein S18 acetylase RimI-like enzyme
MNADNDWHIRSACPDDVIDLAKVHLVAWRAAYHDVIPDDLLDQLTVDDFEAHWMHAFEQASRVNLVCEHGGAVSGFAAIGPTCDHCEPSTAQVYDMYVHPTDWGRGSGRALWVASLNQLRESCYEHVELWVHRVNQRARRFYEAVGCRHDPADVRICTRSGVALDELLYRRETTA